jgi:prepilin-type N-terminal cleavage/methylation domain-containing protein
VRKLKKGMTLIELLVSALILVIGVTPLMMSFAYSNRIVERNTHRMNATTIINAWFENIQRMEDLSKVQDLIGDYTPGNPLGVYQGTGGGAQWKYWLEFDMSTVVTPDPSSDLNIIAARVTWDKTYNENTDNSISMLMYTNEP